MANNSDGSIVLSVKIDTDNLKSQTKKLNDEILKAVKSESKIAVETEKANQALLKTQILQEKLNALKEKTRSETEKANVSESKAAEAAQKVVAAEQKVQTEKAKTAAETSKAETAEINKAKAVVQTVTAIQRQNTEAERTSQAFEKTKQEQEKTRQAFEKTFQEQEKSRQSVEKTAQSIEKTKQAQEKTTQETRKTKLAQEKLKNATTKVATVMKQVATQLGIIFGMREILRFSNEASKLASQQEANLKRLSMLYGENTKQVYDFVNANANAFGMAKSAAYQAAADYGNLFRTFSDGAESAKLTNEMLQATAVIASQTGRTYEDVFEKIRSGLYGNTRAIDDLGITVRKAGLQQTQAFQTVSGGVKKWNDLTDAELQHARALGIVEQTYKLYGNTVIQSTALTRSQFNAAWTDFKATWGTAINIVLMPILQVVTKILNAATAALSAILKFFGKEVSVTSDSMQSISAGSGTMSDNIKDASKNQKGLNKELKKTLAGFDELQILQDNSSNEKSGKDTGGSAGGTGGGITATPKVETTDVSSEMKIDTSAWEKFLEIVEKIKAVFLSGFWESFKNADFSGITNAIDGIKTSLTNIWTSTEVTTAMQNFGTNFVYALGQSTGSVVSIGTTIATNLLSGLDQYFSENAPFIQQCIAKIFDAGAGIYKSVGNLWSAFANIFSVFVETNGTTLTSNIIGIFSNAALGIQTLAAQMGADFINFLTQPIIDNQEQLKTALDGILGFFADITGGIKILIDDLVQNALTLYEEHISPLIQSITDTVSQMVQIFLDKWEQNIQPLLDKIGTEFKALVEEHLAPMFDKIFEFVGKVFEVVQPIWDNLLSPLITKIWDDFIGILLDYIANLGERLWEFTDNVFTTISDLISDIMDILNGIIDFLVGTFTGDWKRAWDGLKSVFKGVLNGIVDLFEGLINFVIDGLNVFVSKLDTVVSIVGEIVGKDWDIPNIPHVKLPRLAQGAVIPANREFLAVLGDQKRGTNIEAPAELIKQMAKEAITEMGGVGVQNQVVREEHYYLDQTELMTIMYKLVKGGERLKGTSLINQGGVI